MRSSSFLKLSGQRRLFKPLSAHRSVDTGPYKEENMDKKKFQKEFDKMVAKAWGDNDFKTQLLSDPMKVFKDNGIEVLEGIEVRMVENTDDIVHFILPPKISNELTGDQLKGVAGGGYFEDCWNWWKDNVFT